MTIKEISYEIGINQSRLLTLIDNSASFYKTYRIKKKDGSYRIINAPGIEIKAIQLWILRNILEKKLHPSEYAHAYYKSRGIKTNATMHLHKKFIYCLDIKDFFPSIYIDKIVPIFKSINSINSTLANQLGRICTYLLRLPQGGITSPYLSNLVFKDIDNEIGDYCERKNIIYTRYADDLSFSSDYKEGLKDLKPFVEKILIAQRFELNNNKERMLSEGGKMMITGIRLNSKRLTIGRERKRMMRAMLHHLIIKDEKINENSLIGYMSFLNDIEPEYLEKSFVLYRDKLIANKNTNK